MTEAAPKQANKRGTARLAAVQALYQMDLAGTGLNEVLASFEVFWMGREIEGDEYLPADADYFRVIVKGVQADQLRIDAAVDTLLNEKWPLTRIESVMRATLRAGAFELFHTKDVPPRVIITEYCDIAAAFLERDEVSMVNAVLDAIAQRVRLEDLAKKG